MARRTLVPLLACALAFGACPARPTDESRSTVVDPKTRTPFMRGVGLGLFATDPDYDYRPLLDEVVAHGATDVLIAVVWYQGDIHASDIHPVPGLTPSDENVRRTLVAAKERGLRTALLPIVRLERHTRDEWRGRIAPIAGVDAWFASYGAFIRTMADLATAAKVDRLGIGSELLSLEKHEPQWRALVREVRARYTGRVFYSANWDHYRPIKFWDALDEVGVTSYFELTRREDGPPTDDEILRAWDAPQDDLRRFAREVGKPLFISEIGYPAKSTAARWPWDETRKAPIDLALQARLYDRFCDAFAGSGVVSGVYFWNWFGFGGANDDSYTPRGKPAAESMRRCLRRPEWDRRG